jgi:ElaA protein
VLELTNKKFNELSLNELYHILKFRQDIFIVEQNSIYHDIDDYDIDAIHVLAYKENILTAYGRILSKGTKFKEVSIGRFLIHKNKRSHGYGSELINYCIQTCQNIFPNENIMISAQISLESYYQKIGFKTVSDPYDDGGILHVDMQLSSKS